MTRVLKKNAGRTVQAYLELEGATRVLTVDNNDGTCEVTDQSAAGPRGVEAFAVPAPDASPGSAAPAGAGVRSMSRGGVGEGGGKKAAAGVKRTRGGRRKGSK